jgi:hypothetical protein
MMDMHIVLTVKEGDLPEGTKKIPRATTRKLTTSMHF